MKSLRNSNSHRSISFLERIIAVATYVTLGMVGFVWLIICALAKVKLTNFLKYHIFQSFFLVMGYFLLETFVGLLVSIFSAIPVINILVYKLLFLFTAPMIFGFSLVQFIILVGMTYLGLTSLQGRYSYVPWISNIIDSNVGR